MVFIPLHKKTEQHEGKLQNRPEHNIGVKKFSLPTLLAEIGEKPGQS